MSMFRRRTIIWSLPALRRTKGTILILASLMFGVWLLYNVMKKSPGMLPQYDLKVSIFHPIPYTNLAQCERLQNGEINCPDIRHKGTTLLRQAQLVLTRILRIFDLVAKKHDIRYWLYKGTLLGAVRHGGHDPFDDDVDICIPDADFEKFIKYGAKELPGDIFFQTEETDVHWKIPPQWSGMFGKLRDTRSCYKSCIHGEHNDGLMLDMFVVENDSDGNFVEWYIHTNWFLRRLNYGRIVRKQSDIFPLTEVNFDGFRLPAPREWKKILTSLYGDFMTIPAGKALAHSVTDPVHSCDQIT